MLGTWLIGAEEEEAVLNVLRAQSLFRHYGPNLQHAATHFETAIADACQLPYALAVNSGTSALRCAIMALGLQPGDEVIVPPCTFVATVNAVVLAGGIPVFAEIDTTLGLDPHKLTERITDRTVGVIPVHLQGMPCRIDQVCEVAKKHGLWVIEDAAQAMGCVYQNQAVGTFGDVGVFSLQAHKTITCGEGGILVTKDEQLYRRARRFQDQGGERKGDAYPDWGHPQAGFGENLKISELHAAVGHQQLKKLPAICEKMRHIHHHLIHHLSFGERALRTDLSPQGSVPYSLIFLAHDQEDRHMLFEALERFEIPVDGLYDYPVYRCPPMARWAAGEPVFGLPGNAPTPHFEPCSFSEALMARLVRIPLSPAYGETEFEHLEACFQALHPAKAVL